MRVLFLTLYPEMAASPRYRVHQFIPYLESQGIECTVRAPMDNGTWQRLTGPNRAGRPFWYHARETPARIVQLLDAGRYDVVFVQKGILSAYIRGMERLIRGRARRLVYDIDDAVHLAPPHGLRGPWRALEDRDQVRKVIASADRVLAGNRWLAEVASGLGARAELFPTVVDTARFTPASVGPQAFQVGWMGSPSTTASLGTIAAAFDTLGPGELVLAGADPKQVHWPQARETPWHYDTEVQLLQQFSVGLMPLPKDEWTRGKCALKALQYMACGVPCIATPHGAVLDVIRHGENGWLADTDADWRDGLDALRDPGLRHRLGAAARATVEEHFSLQIAAPRLADLLETL
jgi:glycosyltransferase involved in cell wall biosynthesis